MIWLLATLACTARPTPEPPPPELERDEVGRVVGRSYAIEFNALPVEPTPGAMVSPGVLVGYDRHVLKSFPRDGADACTAAVVGPVFDVDTSSFSSRVCEDGRVAVHQLTSGPEDTIQVGLAEHFDAGAVSTLSSTPWGGLLAGRTGTDGDYATGWPAELVMTGKGGGLRVDRRAMGRFVDPTFQVMPDNKTVYIAQGADDAALFMFVADKAGDLSAGTLYAAHLTTAGGVGIANFRVAWVPMQRAESRWMDSLMGLSKDDVLKTVPALQGRCTEAFRTVQSLGALECIRAAPVSETVNNPPLAASRLEPNRYAGWLGASTEFAAVSDVALDPARKALFLSMPRISGRMLAEGGGPDDQVRMAAAPCGAVMVGYGTDGQMSMDGKPIPSEHALAELRVLLSTQSDAETDECTSSQLSRPGPLAFVPLFDRLLIGEEAVEGQRPTAWILDTSRSVLARWAEGPEGSGIHSVGVAPVVDGHGYFWLSTGPDADASQILGPLPPLD